MGLFESLIFKRVIKSIGTFVLGIVFIFIPVIGPILFLICIYFTGRLLYEAWVESEREFAVTNRNNVPDVIFDPRRSIIQGYEDNDSIENQRKN